MLARQTRSPDERTNFRTAAPFLVLNLLPVLVVFTGITPTAAVLFVITFVVRMFCITGGYHRYFAHRTYRLARVPQAILAFGGLTAVQKGPLWWASHHRDHHRYSDTDRDPHSPQKGFWYSHMGWITCGKYGATEYDKIADFAKFPELVWMNKHDWVGPWSLGIACFLIGGWSGLVVGFFASTVLLWHCTFAINSLAHLVGRRRYATTDTSRNWWPLAIMAMGEGWHNNHHHFPSCARQGFRWWEIDITYYVLRALAVVRIVHDLREPPAAVQRTKLLRDGEVDVGMVRYHLSRASSVVQAGSSAPADAIVGIVEGTAAEIAVVAKGARERARTAAPDGERLDAPVSV